MKVETRLIAYLKGRIDCQVCADVPNPRPDQLVTIERTGGSSDSIVIDRPNVAIQCWAGTRAEALNLTSAVEIAMEGISSCDWCYNASKNSDYYYPGEGGEPRYQLVYDLACDTRE